MRRVGQSARNSKIFIYISNWIISIFKHVAGEPEGSSNVLHGDRLDPRPVDCQLGTDHVGWCACRVSSSFPVGPRYSGGGSRPQLARVCHRYAENVRVGSCDCSTDEPHDGFVRCRPARR